MRTDAEPLPRINLPLTDPSPSRPALRTRASGRVGRTHALLLELGQRALVLAETIEVHAAQHVRGLGELDALVARDLDPVWIVTP